MDLAKFSVRQIFLTFCAVLVLLLLADFNNRWNDRQRLAEQYDLAVQEYAALQMTEVVLSTQIAHAESDAAVEAWAYEQAGLARPGDFVIIPQPAPGGLPTPTPTQMPTPIPQDNWDLWWSLFFDPDEPDS